jgi:UDP-N-acetylglucosamine acyltransferase
MTASKDTIIHGSAIVEKGAELDEGVRVGPFAFIGPKVRVGSDTIIHSHAVIDGKTTMGRNNHVFNGAVLGTIPQDLKYDGEDTELVIGEKNTFREFCTIHKGTADGGGTTNIGDANLFMAYCHVAQDCEVESGNVLANATSVGGHVLIGNFTVLGAMSGIHQFCRVGDMTMVGAGSMVVQDAPPYSIVQGDRARLKGLNVVGLKRRGISPEGVDTLKKAFRLIFRSGLRLETAIQTFADTQEQTEEVARLISFLQSSGRGFIR